MTSSLQQNGTIVPLFTVVLPGKWSNFPVTHSSWRRQTIHDILHVSSWSLRLLSYVCVSTGSLPLIMIETEAVEHFSWQTDSQSRPEECVRVSFGGLVMLREASVWEYVYVYMWFFIHGSHSVECGGTAVVVLVCCSLASSGGQSETLRFSSHHCWENNRTRLLKLRQLIGKFMMSKKWKRIYLLDKTNLLLEKPTRFTGLKMYKGKSHTIWCHSPLNHLMAQKLTTALL